MEDQEKRDRLLELLERYSGQNNEFGEMAALSREALDGFSRRLESANDTIEGTSEMLEGLKAKVGEMDEDVYVVVWTVDGQILHRGFDDQEPPMEFYDAIGDRSKAVFLVRDLVEQNDVGDDDEWVGGLQKEFLDKLRGLSGPGAGSETSSSALTLDVDVEAGNGDEMD